MILRTGLTVQLVCRCLLSVGVCRYQLARARVSCPARRNWPPLRPQGAGQLRAGEVGAGKVRACQVGVGEVGAGEPGAAEVRAGEVRAAQGPRRLGPRG